MEEVEFSQRIVKILDEKTLQDTLKKATTQGFTVSGFSKKIYQAPPAILVTAMKTKKRKKGFQSGIFLKCLSELGENILESTLAQKWLAGGVSRKEAESELKNIEISILKKQKQHEYVPDIFEIDSSIKGNNIEDNTKVIEKQKEHIEKLKATLQNYKILNDNYKKEIENNGKVNGEVIEKQKEHIKKLKTTLQDHKILNDNYKKKIEQLQKENNKLKLKDEEELKDKISREDIIEELKTKINEQQEQLVEMKKEIERYKNMYENAPKILCFSRKEVNKEVFPFYHIEWIGEWNNDLVKIIDWKKYHEIWVAENDFTYSETKTIKDMAKGKIITARNLNMLIEKVGGNN